jgi:hypothetical protein
VRDFVGGVVDEAVEPVRMGVDVYKAGKYLIQDELGQNPQLPDFWSNLANDMPRDPQKIREYFWEKQKQNLINGAVGGGMVGGGKLIKRGWKYLKGGKLVRKGGRILGARSELDLANEVGKGLGKLKGVKITPTQAEIDLIEQHLSKFPKDAPNAAMLARIKTALQEGRALVGADAHFYAHELLEQKVMKELMQGGHYTFKEAYDVAHRYALDFYRASNYSVYHPDVIKANPAEFNPNWLKFWESMKCSN